MHHAERRGLRQQLGRRRAAKELISTNCDDAVILDDIKRLECLERTNHSLFLECKALRERISILAPPVDIEEETECIIVPEDPANRETPQLSAEQKQSYSIGPDKAIFFSRLSRWLSR